MQDENNNLDEINSENSTESNDLLDGLEEEILDRGEFKRFIGFTVGNKSCAIPLDNVVEIGNIPKTTFTPNVPRWVNGVFNFRGEIVSAIGFSKFFDIENTTDKNMEKMILVKSLYNDISTALFVDSIIRVFNIYEDEIQTIDNPSKDLLSEFIDGTYSHEDTLVDIFDIEKYLASPDINQFN